MSEHDNPLRFNVGFIIAEASGYSRDIPFYARRVRLDPELFLDEIDGTVVFTRTAEGILAQVSALATEPVDCSRCLDAFALKVKVEFSELYNFSTHAKDDTELILPQTGYIDLTPVLREYVLLETPINPVCKEDCRGLCPVCGENLNKSDCHHEEEAIDPRLLKLKGLLE